MYCMMLMSMVSHCCTQDMEEEEDISKEERVLKEIEKQALVQGVMQQLAKNLNPADPQGINAVSHI